MAKEEKEVQEEIVQPKGSYVKFIVLGVLVIVLGGGGFIGWNFIMKDGDRGSLASIKKSQTQENTPGLTHPLESFIVNLMDKAGLGKRYLKVNILLEVDGEKEEAIVAQYTPQLRDTILLQLSSRSYSEAFADRVTAASRGCPIRF